MRPTYSHETSVNKYEPTPRNTPEVRRPQLRRGGSLNFRNSRIAERKFLKLCNLENFLTSAVAFGYWLNRTTTTTNKQQQRGLHTMARNIYSTHYTLNAACDASTTRCTATPNSKFWKKQGGVLTSCAILNSSGRILLHRVSSYLLSSSRTTQ